MRPTGTPTRSVARASRAGVTLVEMMVTVVVLGIVGVATLPVILAVSTGYSESTRTRAALERNAFAADRVTRWIREIPEGSVAGSVAIASASATAITLTDGRSISLNNGTLIQKGVTGSGETLVENVTSMEFKLYASDGVTSTLAQPALTQRVAFTLTSDGATLASAAFIRARSTEP